MDTLMPAFSSIAKGATIGAHPRASSARLAQGCSREVTRESVGCVHRGTAPRGRAAQEKTRSARGTPEPAVHQEYDHARSAQSAARSGADAASLVQRSAPE